MDYSELSNKKRIRSPHTTRVRNKVGLLILRISMAVVLIVGFAGAGAGIGTYLGILRNSPELDITGLGVVSFDEDGGGAQLTSFIVDQYGNERERLHGGVNYEFASYDELPEHLINAFLAIEDQRFFEHNGIDPRGMARAAWAFTQPDRQLEGASTITQQLVNNMLGIFGNKTFVNKLQEQFIAINFETHLAQEFEALGYEDPRLEAKKYILQSYLNIINLGQTNHGVKAAAWFYYGVDVSELTIAQSASIAAIAQNPSAFPPDIRPRNNWRRTQLVLKNMYRLGLITEEEFEEAMQARQLVDEITGDPLFDEDGEPIMLGLVYDTLFRNESGATRDIISEYDCFTDALIRQVRNDLMREYSLTGEQADRRIFTGGIQIYSTQDMEIQAIVDEAFLNPSLWPGSNAGFSIEVTYSFSVFNSITQQRRHYQRKHVVPNEAAADAFIQSVQEEVLTAADVIEPESERQFRVPQPQGAFVLIDHHTGHVLAMRGIRGEKQGNRAFNRATEALRSPGSQMKPLAPFTPLIDMGIYSPGSVIDDIPFTLPASRGSGWTPGNHWSGYRGLMTVRTAISSSANVVSARAAADSTIPHAGVPMMVRYLENMGISTIHQNDGAALVLGGMTNGVRLIELAGAYATIANGGEYNRPVLYTVVRDHEGNIILENPHNPERVLRATTAYMLTNSMEGTVTHGTGTRANWTTGSGLRGRIPIAGKTGTSQRNSDLGFSGFTPYYTASIWLGNDNHTSMHR
ncbi:MAG: transglycosylase domain-containing protein, partial [Clostridiales bacterium]|nr:transglycosylase domain-containing protein [Clostridiales bacterium]